MAARVNSERELFFHAIDLECSEERSDYLEKACGDDSELRASVDALLKAHELPARLLDHAIGPVSLARFDGPVPIDATLTLTAEQHVGQQIGDYRLMEQIGEGGFGLVFVAQQDKPVKRRVALKIVKPGQGSKEVIARFEAERQAVALMDHTNIAQVFDAGVTEDGRPYFVMELVRGVPITEFCDNQQLSVNDRLRLFCDVCQAVHHAHQKGVIHRDIKPSNVMVTLLDGHPVAKVIDFGVAKAIGQSLTDKTIYTRFFSIIGTPLYMSPEQAEMSGVDVDTRSDIYSLGVLLYELLIGATPFDRERLDSAGFDELRQIIREEEPPLPSARFTTLAGTSSTVADRRRTSPVRLTSNIRGDLDWIVMKALNKDRQRRYESAASMAEDVRRHLSEQPIEARPPSRLYLVSKFTKRNRVVIVTMSLIAMSMFVGTVLSLWQMRVAMQERDEKEAALIEIEQFAETMTSANLLIASARLHTDAGRMDDAIADLDAAVDQQPSYYLSWVSRGHHYAQLQMWTEAARDYAKALELGSPVDTPSWWGTSALFELAGEIDAHDQLLRQLEEHLVEGNPVRDWEWVRNCVTTPDGLSNESLAKLQMIAAEWFSRQERRGPPRPESRPESRPGPPPSGRFGPPDEVRLLPRPVCEYILGMIHLRMGEMDNAIDLFQRCGNDPNWPAVGLAHAPLAIAYFQKGDSRRAKDELEHARLAIEQLEETMEWETTGRPSTPWFDLVEMRTTSQEAARLLNSSP